MDIKSKKSDTEELNEGSNNEKKKNFGRFKAVLTSGMMRTEIILAISLRTDILPARNLSQVRTICIRRSALLLRFISETVRTENFRAAKICTKISCVL